MFMQGGGCFRGSQFRVGKFVFQICRHIPHTSGRYCGLRWGVVQDLYRPTRFLVDFRFKL